MRCTQCGAILPDLGADSMGRVPKFCTKCGAPLERFVEEAPQAPAWNSAPDLDAPGPDAPEYPRGFRQNAAGAPLDPPPPIMPPPDMPMSPPPKKRKGPVIWIVAAVAAVALLVAGFFTVHIWKDADCENPDTCAICGKTRGKALGHDWTAATCLEPKTCDRCGEEVGGALGHDWQNADCENPKTCARCGETEGDALGHDWQDATYDAPKTCARCGETEGQVLGWVGNVKFTLEDSDTVIGSSTSHAFVFDEPLVGLRKMTVRFTLTEYTGSPFGTYAVYVHSEARGWYSAQTFQVSSEDVNKQLVVPITFSDTPTIDKVLVLCEKNATFTVKYSLNITDVQIS